MSHPARFVLDNLVRDEHHADRLFMYFLRRQRRVWLERGLRDHGSILGGTFKGLLLPRDAVHDNLTFAQLVGCYERQVQAVVKEHVGNYKRFVDIGCACGVYTNGVTRTYGVPSIGIDLDPSQVERADRISRANGLTDITHVAPPEGYDPMEYIDDGSFVMVDIEGAEWHLLDALDPAKVPNAMFLIELHKYGSKGLDELEARIRADFEPTHDVDMVHEATGGVSIDLETWTTLSEMGVPRTFAPMLVAELRDYYQRWAIITPKPRAR